VPAGGGGGGARRQMTLTVGGCVAIRERETLPSNAPASVATYPDDVMYAIEGATFIAEHLKDEDEGANVSVKNHYCTMRLMRKPFFCF